MAFEGLAKIDDCMDAKLNAFQFTLNLVQTAVIVRFSGMKQDRPLKTSWQRKMHQKADMKNLKAFEAELKEAKNEELEVGQYKEQWSSLP